MISKILSVRLAVLFFSIQFVFISAAIAQDSRFTVSDVSVAEGNSGLTNFDFQITRSDTTANASVDYVAVAGTASLSDFVGAPVNTASFGIGVSSQTVTVSVQSDTVVEADETFRLMLSNPSLGSTIIDTEAVGTILNDDIANLSITDFIAPITESDSGSSVIHTFTVSLDNNVDRPVLVDFSTTSGNALAGSDFTATSGTLSFTGTAGQTRTISVTVSGDDLVELSENYFVNLSNIRASGRNVVFLDNQGESIIANDDSATISIDDVTKVEGNAGSETFVFTVTMNGAVDVPVTVDVDSLDGTATLADSDYLVLDTDVTFPALGSSPATTSVNLSVSGDEVVELNEQLMLTLSALSASGRSVSISDSTGLATITNDDSATVSIEDKNVSETNSGLTVVTLNATLSAATSAPIAFDFSTSDGTASVADSDYSPATGTLSFTGSAGENVPVSISIVGDTRLETDQTLSILLSGLDASGLDVAFADSEGVLMILNDDVNNLPSVLGEMNSTDEDTPIEVSASGVLSNDTDIDEGHQASLIVSDFEALSAKGAAVTVNGDGSFSYDPAQSALLQQLALGATESDSFSYTVRDPEGAEVSGTVSIEVAGKTEPLAFLWNGFIDILNIVSIYNTDDTTSSNVTLRMYDIAGVLQSTTEVTIAAGQNSDFILNDLAGFSTDSYGLFTVTYDSPKVEGYGTYYRYNDIDPDVLDFKSSVSLDEGAFGETFTAFNTIPPSAAEASVANFLTLVNDDDAPSTFTIEFFDISGASLFTNGVTILPKGRVDLQAGHESPGANRVGTIKVTPADANQRYFAQLNRYGLDANNALTSFQLPIAARAGSEGLGAFVSSGASGRNFIVLSSTSASAQNVKLDIIDDAAGLTSSETYNLAPYQQVHIDANPALLAGLSGTAIASTMTSGGGFILDSSVYFVEAEAVTAAYSTSGRSSLPAVSFANYNTFIGQFNQLKLFNASSTSETVTLTLGDSSGTPLGFTSIVLPAMSGRDVSIEGLSFGPGIETIGRVKVEASAADTVAAEMLQVRGDGTSIDAAAAVPLR